MCACVCLLACVCVLAWWGRGVCACARASYVLACVLVCVCVLACVCVLTCVCSVGYDRVWTLLICVVEVVIVVATTTTLCCGRGVYLISNVLCAMCLYVCTYMHVWWGRGCACARVCVY